MRSHPRDDDRKAQLRGRRGFLKLLTGLGVSATAAQTLTQDGLAQMDVDLDQEVPYVDRYHHSPEAVQTDGPVEREAIHETVSRNHWEEAEAASDASRRIQERIESEIDGANGLIDSLMTWLPDGTLGVKVKYRVQHLAPSADGEANGSQEAARPSVSFEAVERALPSQARGRIPDHAVGPTNDNGGQSDGNAGRGSGRPDISYSNEERTFPVVFEQKETVPACNSGECKTYWYNTEYQDVPGGCNAGKGTLGTPALTTDNYEQRMVSAGHVYDSTGGEGANVEQPNDPLFGDGNVVGIVDDITWNGSHEDSTEDFGIARLPNDDSISYEWKLADDSGGYKNYDIAGSLSRSSIRYHADQTYYTLYKQGSRTGVDCGGITEFHDTENNRYIETEINGGEGDSGGPIFEKFDSGNIYIAAIVVRGGGIDGGCDVRDIEGQTVEYIEDDYNVIV